MADETPLTKPEDLLAKLKSDGYFDEIRKRILENVEASSEFHYAQRSVSAIVSRFLSVQSRPISQQKKFEQREALRRELRGEPFLQRSIRQLTDNLIAKHTSPEILAPSFNKLACEAYGVDYQGWLEYNKHGKVLPQEPVKSEPLLPSPTVGPLLPVPTTDKQDESKPPQKIDAEVENDAALSDAVEMEVDDYGDEMDIESTDSNQSPPRTQEPIESQPSDAALVTLPAPSPSACNDAPTYLNSSSFSRKISSAVTTPIGWTSSTTNAISDVELESPLSLRQNAKTASGTSALDDAKNPSPAKALFLERTLAQQQQRQWPRSSLGGEKARQQDRRHADGPSRLFERSCSLREESIDRRAHPKNANHGDGRSVHRQNSDRRRLHGARNRGGDDLDQRRHSGADFCRRGNANSCSMNRPSQHQNRNGLSLVGDKTVDGSGYRSRRDSSPSSNFSHALSMSIPSHSLSPNPQQHHHRPLHRDQLSATVASANPKRPQKRRRQSSPHSSIPDPVDPPQQRANIRSPFTERRDRRDSPICAQRWNDRNRKPSRRLDRPRLASGRNTNNHGHSRNNNYSRHRPVHQPFDSHNSRVSLGRKKTN